MDLESLSQYVLDTLSPLIYFRWGVAALLMFAYTTRILILQTHDVVTYCVAIYLLHLFVLFATPKDDRIPDPFENTEDEDYNPRNIDNDFRPYVRRLPEFGFWMSATQTLAGAYFLTFFEFTDLPVCKPIMYGYALFILIITLFKLWTHSKKFKYNLFFARKSGLNE